MYNAQSADYESENTDLTDKISKDIEAYLVNSNLISLQDDFDEQEHDKDKFSCNGEIAKILLKAQQH